jgi:hypothetical protein
MHGLVCGRGTGGAAVIGFDEPICGAEGTRTTWARVATAKVDNTTAAKRDERPTRVTGEEAVDQNIYISFQSIRAAIILRRS